MATKLTPTQIAETGDSQQATIIGVLVMLLLIGNSSVVLRVLAQLRVARRIFTEDVLLIFAVVCFNTLRNLCRRSCRGKLPTTN